MHREVSYVAWCWAWWGVLCRMQTAGALESLSHILRYVGQCALMLLLQSLTC